MPDFARFSLALFTPGPLNDGRYFASERERIMQQRKLGQDGPSVGAIGLGCMSFAGVYGSTDEAGAHRTLATALDLGVTHLDTALIYGNGVSESYIGSFIRDHPNRFTIATKGGIVTQPERGASTIPRPICANSWKAR